MDVRFHLFVVVDCVVLFCPLLSCLVEVVVDCFLLVVVLVLVVADDGIATSMVSNDAVEVLWGGWSHNMSSVRSTTIKRRQQQQCDGSSTQKDQ